MVQLFLQHGARARSGDNCIIYLAAVSGRVDVMTILLDAAAISDDGAADAETTARYRQQMSEPDGPLAIAKELRERYLPAWLFARKQNAFQFEPSHELCAALCGRSIARLDWMLSQPTHFALRSNWALEAAVRSGDVDLVRALFNSRSANVSDPCWASSAAAGLRTARAVRNVELITLLFPHSLHRWKHRGLLSDIADAVEANDPFTRQYLFGHFEPDTVDLKTSFEIILVNLMLVCMTGNLSLFDDVWVFVQRMVARRPLLFEVLGPRINRARQCCADGDLTPLTMVLIQASSEQARDRLYFAGESQHPILLAAKCGNLPAVRLWLAQGIPAQWALCTATKHGQQEVISCLIAHGADPSRHCHCCPRSHDCIHHTERS